MKYTSSLGASLIVASMSLGIGMLAMPLVSSSLGLPYSLLLLIAFWIISNASAFLILELNGRFGEVLSIPGLCEKGFGRLGGVIAGVALAGLHISILSAYITGATDILSARLPEWPPLFLSLIFVCVFGGLVRYSRRLTDYMNRLFFIGKVGAFGGFMLLLLPYMKSERLVEQLHSSWPAWGFVMAAAPVYFTSFGFQGSLHSIINHVGSSDVRLIRRIFLSGTLMALVVYMLWVATTLSVTSVNTSSVSEFLAALNNSLCCSRVFQLLADSFAFCSIITSFLGVGIGQFDFVSEAWVRLSKRPLQMKHVAWITFAPSLIWSMVYPKGFLIALGYAGVCLSVLALILPALLALKVWKTPFEHKVMGGLWLRLGVLMAGVIVVLCEILK